MSEGRPTSREYLDSHLEPEVTTQEPAPGSLDIPIFSDGFSPDYAQDIWEPIEHSDGVISMRMQYSHQDQSDQRSLLYRVGISPEFGTSVPKEMKEFFATTVVNLQWLVLTNLDNGGTINLAEILPRGTVVLVNPKDSREIHPGKTALNARLESNIMGLIFIEGDLTRIDTLLTLLHELGHLRGDDSENKAVELTRTTRNINLGIAINEEEAAALLKEERNAWAFALTKFKPFITRENKPLILKKIHDYFLASYSAGIKKSLTPNWLGRMMRFFLDLLDK